MRRCRRSRGFLVDRLRAISAFGIDLVYPRRCAGCGWRGRWLCPRCAGGIELFAPPWCPSCGIPTRLSCRCSPRLGSLDGVRSVGPFEGWLQGAIIGCKYHGEWARTAELAPLLAEVCASLPPIDALVPVPLHPSRLRQRGFNQSLLLARCAANDLKMPVEELVLRTRRTDSQTQLSADDRGRNVEGAMAVGPGGAVAGRSFVLIDDVITTGSTLAACATVLRDAGARSVMAATVCREL